MSEVQEQIKEPVDETILEGQVNEQVKEYNASLMTLLEVLGISLIESPGDMIEKFRVMRAANDDDYNKSEFNV